MTFTVDRGDLVGALELVARVAVRHTKEAKGIVCHLLLEARPDGLLLTATDLDMEARAAVTCRGDGWRGAVLADDLKSIAAAAAVGSQIEFTPDITRLLVRSGKSRFKLPMLPWDDFPVFRRDQGAKKTAFTLGAVDLKRMLTITSPGISTEETRYYLCGTYFHPARDRLVAVSTNGHLLCIAKAGLPEGAGDMPGVILPRPATRILATASGDIEAEIGETVAEFRWGSFSLATKLIEGPFPDYERAFGERANTGFEVDGPGLKVAAARVAMLAEEIGNTRSRVVKLTLRQGEIDLMSTDTDGTEAEDNIEAAVSLAGGPMAVGYDGRYLREVLGLCGEGSVHFFLAAPDAPTQILPASDPEALFVLMPMRV